MEASTSARLREPVPDERRQLRGGGPHVDDGVTHRLQRVLQRGHDLGLGGLGDRGDGVEHDVTAP